MSSRIFHYPAGCRSKTRVRPRLARPQLNEEWPAGPVVCALCALLSRGTCRRGEGRSATTRHERDIGVAAPLPGTCRSRRSTASDRWPRRVPGHPSSRGQLIGLSASRCARAAPSVAKSTHAGRPAPKPGRVARPAARRAPPVQQTYAQQPTYVSTVVTSGSAQTAPASSKTSAAATPHDSGPAPLPAPAGVAPPSPLRSP
jgi:hypothetical protein